MSKVAVLDTNKQVLEPCHPAVARRLLRAGHAAVFRRHPFAIILKRSVPPESVETDPLQLCVDPGARRTGLAIVDSDRAAVFAAELTHRGGAVKRALRSRRLFRKNRRLRNLRHRKRRSLNRGRSVPIVEGGRWVVRRVRATDDVTARFESFNFETTDGAGWVPPSIMSRVYNVHTWVRRLMKIYPIVQIALESVTFNITPGTPSAKRAFPAASTMNALREKLIASMMATGLPIRYGDGETTANYRRESNLPKTHYFDAACIAGAVTLSKGLSVLRIRAKGYGGRRLFRFDAKPNPKATKKKHGFNYGRRRRTSGDGFRQYDHVHIRKKRGQSYLGSINCFVGKAKPNAPRRILVDCPKSANKDRRQGGNTAELTLLQRRDGYSYDRAECPDHF